MGTSYLDDATITTLRDIKRDGFATRLALQGATTLVLVRGATRLAAQDVLVTFAGREAQTQRDDASEAAMADGWFEKASPFDVRRGDQFSLALDGGGFLSGEVTVVYPPDLGIVKAAWQVRAGRIGGA